jgi:hypothetical protein
MPTQRQTRTKHTVRVSRLVFNRLSARRKESNASPALESFFDCQRVETLVVVGKPYDSSEHPAASVLLDEIVGSNDCAGLNGAERWPLEAVLIHKTPAGLSPRLIPSSPQSLNFFSNSMCGLLCLLDFSLIWGGSGNQGQQAQCAISRRSPIPVPQTPLAFLRRAQRNAFRRRDAHQQSRLFVPENPRLRHSPNSNRLYGDCQL